MSDTELILAEVEKCKNDRRYYFNTYIKPPSLPDIPESEWDSKHRQFYGLYCLYSRQSPRKRAGDAIAILMRDGSYLSKLPKYMIDRIKFISNGFDAK